MAGIDYVRRHLTWGWWSLFVFAALGFVLETLHGFKVRAYLDTTNETRRLMWTLAHAHGTLVALIHIAFASTLKSAPEPSRARAATPSNALIAAGIALPLGFFLGGVQFYAGDPGIGVLLVPVGASLLLTAIFLIARRRG